MKKDINSKKDAITTDMQAAEEVMQSFDFPNYGVVIQAKSMQEALAKLKEIIKDNK